LFVDWLRIAHLRCIRSADLRLGPGFVWVAGANGAGKTTLLEAVYLLDRGRTFRGRRSGPVTTRGEAATAVAGGVGERERIRQYRWSSKAGSRDGLGSPFSRFVGASSFSIVDGDPALRHDLSRMRETLLFTALHEAGHPEAEARERFTAPVLAAMAPLLAQILPEAELELAVDFAPRVLRRPGRSDAVERLSGGTREQVAVLARLAFARLLARHGRELPVVLDDALVFSDDARIERMFTALTMAAGDVQVLVLTCRERTFRRLGGTELRLVPWPASKR